MRRLLAVLLITGMVWSGDLYLWAQTNAGLMPPPKMQFFDASGNILSGGCVFTYQAGTSTPQAAYTDSTATTPLSNPVILDAGGFASIWLGSQLYKIVLYSAGGTNCASGTLQYSVDNVSNLGLRALNMSVLLNPTGGANQTVSGPITATYFTGSTAHTTSPGVRVSLIDPASVLDTATNPPNLITVAPAASGHNYRIPDAGGHANFVLNPDSAQAGLNVLDCTQTGITCKRYAFAWFEGGGCNNATAALGWDNFGTNAPVAKCITGSNVQKGVMALPSASSKDQESSGTAAAATTVTTTYPAATSAGDLLVVAIAVDGGKTVSSVTDGTNAYTKVLAKTNLNTDLEIWYFNGNSTAMAAGTTLTVTLSGAADAAIDWLSYKDVLTSGMLDASASNFGTGTIVNTASTPGLAQNTELVLAFVGSPSNPTVAFEPGTNGHAVVSQSTNVTLSSQGLIAQAAGTQTQSFTLGSSQAWAAAIVTFKSNVQGTVTAQRNWMLPPTYISSVPVNAQIKWQAPSAPTGTVNVELGAAVTCAADGTSDDAAFSNPSTATATVNASGANILTTTTFSGLTATGCAANQVMHYQVQRLRYNANDFYEGYIYVNGAGLQFGVN